MQIHELEPTAYISDIADANVFAFDTGERTKKVTTGLLAMKIARDAKVLFPAGDDLEPTEWTDVPLIYNANGIPFSTLHTRLATMAKNVRWLYGKVTELIANLATLTETVTGIENGLPEQVKMVSKQLGASAIPANAMSTITVTNAIDGYTMIGLAGIQLAAIAGVGLQSWYITNGMLKLTLYNTTSAQKNVTPIVYLLYNRN